MYSAVRSCCTCSHALLKSRPNGCVEAPSIQ
jgi:hypothetical protein